MRVFVRTARRFRSRSAGSGFCSCSHVVPHGPGAAGPIVRALFRSVCRKESGSYNSRAPRTTPAKCGSRRRNRIVTLVYMGRHESRSDYRLFDEPACRFDPAETAGNENRTLHRDADPCPRRNGRTVSRRIPNFRHLGTVRFPADSAGYETHAATVFRGERASSQKAATGPDTAANRRTR